MVKDAIVHGHGDVVRVLVSKGAQLLEATKFSHEYMQHGPTWVEQTQAMTPRSTMGLETCACEAQLTLRDFHQSERVSNGGLVPYGGWICRIGAPDLAPSLSENTCFKGFGGKLGVKNGAPNLQMRPSMDPTPHMKTP